MPVLSQKGMSTSSNSRDSTPFCPWRDANLSPGGVGQGREERADDVGLLHRVIHNAADCAFELGANAVHEGSTPMQPQAHFKHAAN